MKRTSFRIIYQSDRVLDSAAGLDECRSYGSGDSLTIFSSFLAKYLPNNTSRFCVVTASRLDIAETCKR
jgi:hypothetical protein